jgi:hypothetical protein
MYTVRIYASDPGSKSGRRKINKNSQGGKTIKETADFVNKQLANIPDDQAGKIVRILIESATAGESGDLKLSFESPKAKETKNGNGEAKAAPKTRK